MFSWLFNNEQEEEDLEFLDILRTFHIDVHISAEEFMKDNGVTVYTYKYFQKCPNCNGTGSTDCKEYPCLKCHQHGLLNYISYNSSYIDTCRYCKGKCRNIPKKLICKECHGFGCLNELVEYTTQQPIREYITVRTFDNLNTKVYVQIDGDIQLKMDYRQNHYVLIVPYEITPEEAVDGFTKDIDLYNRVVNVNKDSITYDGDTMTSDYKIHNCNVVVKFIVKYHDSITVSTK